MSELTVIRNKIKGHRCYINRAVKQLEEIIQEKPKDESQVQPRSQGILPFNNYPRYQKGKMPWERGCHKCSR